MAETEKGQNAYRQAGTATPTGVRLLAQMFLIHNEFRRVSRIERLAQLTLTRLKVMTPYDLALFWHVNGRGRMKRLTIGNHIWGAPSGRRARRRRNKWMRALATHFAKGYDAPTIISPKELARTGFRGGWPQEIPPAGIFVPLRYPNGRVAGGLIMLRKVGWTKPMMTLLGELGEAAAYATRAMELGIHWRDPHRTKRRVRFALVVVVALIAGGVAMDVVPLDRIAERLIDLLRGAV